MSYASAVASPAQRAKAAISVVAIHAVMGFGIVAGLTVNGVIAPEDVGLTTWEFDDTSPPPPPDDTVPPEAPRPSPPMAAPRAPLDLSQPRDITIVEATENDFPVIPIPNNVVDIPVLDPPGPPAAFTPVGPVPRNGPIGWITNDDYSTSDLRRGNEGTARYRLVVGSDGQVDACEITSSTGHASLDRTTCRLIERRARFNAATNSSGERVVGTYSGVVTWRIPE